MKTLKITIVATLASTIVWFLHLPHKIWPEHPYLADTLLAIAIYVVLQYAWSDAKPAPKPGLDKE